MSAEAGSQAVRGHVGLVYLPETSADDPRFSFGLTTAAAGACGALRPFDRLELGLCGELQIGAIHAVVHDALPVDPGDQLWLAAGLGPRLGFEVWLPFVLEVGVTAVVPILDRSFDVKGIEEPAFEPASVGAIGFAGVRMQTP